MLLSSKLWSQAPDIVPPSLSTH